MAFFQNLKKKEKITKKNNENRRKISNMRGRNFTKIGSYVESVTKSFLFNGRSQKMKRKEVWRPDRFSLKIGQWDRRKEKELSNI